jgi:uncharacterized membrane protein SpoIIM required for sporulation
MREATFVERGTERWHRLDDLLNATDRASLSGIGGDALVELGTLYRRVTSDLAYAQARGYDERLVLYLNRLAVRANGVVYSGSTRSSWARIRDFFACDFPREVRRSWIPIALCAALFFGPWIVSYVLVTHDPTSAAAFLGDGYPEIKKSLHDSNFAVAASNAPAMSAEIITNNIRVAIIAFAGGMTLGALTVYSIVFQGLFFGAYQALFANAGFGYDFFATVAPHGGFELTAIVIAGGSGLLMAGGVFAPGRLPRRVALARYGRRAGVLIVGVCVMLLFAGLNEGFVSPRRAPPELRLAIGIVYILFLIAYFAFAGRGRQTAPRDLTAT